MSILSNPLFVTRLAGLLALAATIYFPTANEEKLAGVLTLVISFVVGKLEKQPEAMKKAVEEAKK